MRRFFAKSTASPVLVQLGLWSPEEAAEAMRAQRAARAKQREVAAQPPQETAAAPSVKPSESPKAAAATSSTKSAATAPSVKSIKTPKAAYSISREQPAETELVAFTDGSCIHNGKRNARAGYAVVWPYDEKLNIAERVRGMQTNNRAEFSAAIKALEIANRVDPESKRRLFVYTDSMLLINTVTKWLPGWKRKGWRKATGDGEIANLDLVKELDKLTGARQVIWTHVVAHTGKQDWVSRWNDLADANAKKVTN